jgi:hypothetical protein
MAAPRLPLLVLVLALPAAARAATEPLLDTPLFQPRSVTAARAAGAIRVDGVLDEPAWAAAAPASDLIQQGPVPGAPARLRTSFRVLFDDHALYVGVRLDDPAVAQLQAPLGRRDDENPSDWCFVEIDSRRDRRTAYSFGVNPAGQQVDGVFVNDIDYDASWNAVWESATHVDATGWSIEYRIPFSVFAFQPPDAGAAMRWGINVYRSNPHTGEVANWSPRVPELAGVVSRFNELVVGAAPRVHRLDLTPYALVQADRTGALDARAGLDANVGLTPSLALSATLLPDFGQVEADPTQLNLTAFELFQQERRPFFTEGIDAFKFDTALALVTRDDSFADEAAFYSRRIGRAPEGDVPPGADAPLATDILGAAKLFGRTASGWRAGVLAAATGGADATLAGTRTPVAAATEAVVARVVREADGGNAALGIFASGLHRHTDGVLAEQLTDTAGALGADARIRWSGQTYEARAWALATEQRGTAAAIARLAAAPWHNLGRPDAPRLRLDPGATHLAGGAAEARLARVGGALLWSVAARAISPGFDVNGLGFQRNTDWALVAGQWSYARYPAAGGWLRKWTVGSANAGLGYSWGGERRAAVADAYGRLDLASYWDATITLQHELAVRSTEWLRGGPALVLPPRDQAKLAIHTDTRRTSFAGLDAAVAREPGSGSRLATVTPSLTLRASDHVVATLGASYADQVIGWQVVAGAPADTYLAARLHQRTASLSLQADLAFSPRLILQLYAQPFATVGRLSRYALLADPLAARAQDRFHTLTPDEVTVSADRVMVRGAAPFEVARPDGVARSLVASAVLRWELAPGSFLTAVYSHRGDAGALDPYARLGSSLTDALREPGADVFLVKLGWRWAP